MDSLDDYALDLRPGRPQSGVTNLPLRFFIKCDREPGPTLWYFHTAKEMTEALFRIMAERGPIEFMVRN